MVGSGFSNKNKVLTLHLHVTGIAQTTIEESDDEDEE